MMVRCPRHTKVPWVEKNQNIRPMSVVALNMSTGSPEASSAILHHKIRICLVGASGCAARPRSVSQQGWSESLKKEKKILVWKSGRKTLVSFWKMSTGWHTPLRGSFENVVIVLTPPFFLTYVLPGDQETFLNACSPSHFVSLCRAFTEHYKLTSRVNKLKCWISSPLQFDFC